MRRPVAIALLHCLLVACGASTGLVTPPVEDVPVAEDRDFGTPRGPYDNCVLGQSCNGGTTCLPVDLTAGARPARLCTNTCTRASCPSRGVHSGLPVSCIVVGTTDSTGQCLESCDNDRQCGLGTRCTTLPVGLLPVCVPVAD